LKIVNYKFKTYRNHNRISCKISLFQLIVATSNFCLREQKEATTCDNNEIKWEVLNAWVVFRGRILKANLG